MDIIIAIIVSSMLSSAATVLILLLNSKAKFVGTLVIDRSDPDAPPLPCLEINKGVGGVEGVAKCKYVTLAIENRNYLPQD